VPAHSPDHQSDPLATDPDGLALVAAGFPAFHIWRSVTVYRSRYVAQSLSLSTHPHTVITDNLEELIAELSADVPRHGHSAVMSVAGNTTRPPSA
jgi:hypothetical protein